MRFAFHRVSQRITRTWRQARPGSVLILVVALLVLMALIGTAFLSTSRNDRYSTVQNTSNTEIDLLVQGVKNMATAIIVGSLYDPSQPDSTFKPANSATYHNWTALDTYHQFSDDPNIGTIANDSWLSPRAPSIAQVPGSNPASYIPVWPCIGNPLVGKVFESPFVITSAGALTGAQSFTFNDRMTADFAPDTSVNATSNSSWGKNDPAHGSQLHPTYATITNPDGSISTYPAWSINTYNSAGTLTSTAFYLAGDADADGVADCGMFKLPIGQLNGLTYYVGVRIVDNSSAVNVTTAMSRRYDFSGTYAATRTWNAGAYAYPNGIFNLGYFPNNVGLTEMLHTYDGTGTMLFGGTGTLSSELINWTKVRLNGSTSANGIATASPPALATLSNGTYGIGEDGAARSDFAYTSFGDMLASQLGRRPEVPGYLTSGGTRAIAASPGDAAALAYHFVFRNPSASPSPLETAMLYSTVFSAPNGTGSLSTGTASITNRGFFTSPQNSLSATSYQGSTANAQAIVSQWYAENFDWDGFPLAGMTVGAMPTAESCMTVAGATSATAAATDLPRRSILTGLSTSSNVIPRPQGTLPPGTTMATNAPFTPTMCKTAINTAPLDQLWRAYWLSMIVDDGTTQISPLGDETKVGHSLLTGQSIYTGSEFNQTAIADATTGASSGQKSDAFLSDIAGPYHQNPQRMFRSSLRIPADTTASNVYYPNGMYLKATEMVKVRSAIAAVNTAAMRDAAMGTFGSGETVPMLDVPVNITGLGAANVRVFGTTRQPYITEVYANTNITASQSTGATAGMTNGAPYVAIELYNPYPGDINLTGWQLVALDRTPGSNEHRNPTVIYTFAATDSVPGAANTANGTAPYQGGYLLLENFGSSGVTYRPASSQLPPTGPLTNRPGAAGSPGTPPTPSVSPLNIISSVPLEQAINRELVLVRPRVAASTTEAIDQVPIDSFDFTGLQPSAPATGADVWHYVRANAIDLTVPLSQQFNGLWRFIYPGRYDASDPTPYASTAYTGTAPPTVTGGPAQNPSFSAYSRRQQGTEAGHFQPYPFTGSGPPPAPGSGIDPFEGGGSGTTAIVPVTLGKDTTGTDQPNDNTAGASYPVTFPFQYLNTNQPGPYTAHVASATSLNAFPFGGFARDSDILQVPFVGGYVVTLAAGDMTNVIEMNAITMDCSFAEDTDVNDDPPRQGFNAATSGTSVDTDSVGPWANVESVGHFSPINASTVNLVNGTKVTDGDPTLAFTEATDRYAAYKSPDQMIAAYPFYWRYRWASRVLDYLTVQSPNDDYQPNVNPTGYPGGTAPVGVANSFISSTAGTSLNHAEDTVPTYGQINLNTAPWRVLAALRFCPYDDADPRASQFVIDEASGTVTAQATPGAAANVPDNVQLAKAIATWRDRIGSSAAPQTYDTTTGRTSANAWQFVRNKGPFYTLADLFEVPAVRNYVQALSFAANAPEPDINFGHFVFSGASTTDGVRNDYEERYDLLHRIGQQATVRSDTFTVYIVIQGWRNAQSTSASAPPQLVTQRRAAFMVDRSSVNPTNTDPRVYNVPQD